ncbi:MAG: hypothetical protein JO363_13415, partial [Solirubrobacterales bacterium]|nr:hypothetical protein [Solirubrobacterales bacterium]
LAERKLLGSSEVTVRCTADELLARMSQAFDEVGSVVAQFGQAWDTLTPRLTAARGMFDHARALADSLGESGRTDLEDAAERLTRLTGTLTADPLSVEPMDVDRLSESVEAIRRELEAANALRGELDARVADARRLLTELQRVVDEGRAGHEELLM